MVLKPLFMLPVLSTVLLLTLAGCEDHAAGTPGPWGGRIVRSAARTELRGAVWRNFPEWQSWAELADRPEIAVNGLIAIPGAQEMMAFQCRMVRLAGMRYSFSLLAELNGAPLSMRGETDLEKHTAALDIQGRFDPVQYESWFGLTPKLASGMADIKGSVLFSGGAQTMTFPLLSVTPVGDAVFQLGAFPLRHGRFDRRETFDGRTELESYGVTAQVGSMRLDFTRITLDREQAVFQAQLVPPSDWQCTVRPRGTGDCALASGGRWKMTAELPEPGVFRLKGAILSLRDLRMTGAGDAEGGSWEWQGDGASLTLQGAAVTGTGTEIRVAGHRDFRFDGRQSADQRRTDSLVCGRFEMPLGGGRITLEQPHLETRHLSGGVLECRSEVAEAVWRMKNGRTLRLKTLSGVMELLTSGTRFLSTDPGSFQAQSAELTGPEPQLRTGMLKGSLLLQERAWKLTAVPENVTAAFRNYAFELPSPQLTLTGGAPDAPDRCTLEGTGKQGKIALDEFGTVKYSGWTGRLDLADMFSAAGDFSLALTDVEGGQGKHVWRAARIEAMGRSEADGWSGRFAVSEFSGKSASGEVYRLTAAVPFGRNVETPGKITLAKLDFRGLKLSELDAELRKSADGQSVKGRAKDDRTGGVCFFSGSVRADLAQGAVEYSIPSATMHSEMEADELLPIPGGWIFSGKLGESGRISWHGGVPEWQRKCTFSGFARNPECMAEDLSGDIVFSGRRDAELRFRFRRLIAGRHTADDGEIRLMSKDGVLSLADAKFSVWGGVWKAHPDGGFAVSRARLTTLLPLDGWNEALSGTFSGTVRLNESLAVQEADLTADSAEVMKLSCLEPYRLLPAEGYNIYDLAFTEAAVRDFHYRTLKFKLVRRPKDITLRISGEGHPSQPVPFVFKGGICRPTERGEAGFAGEVEIGCGYRISDRELGLMSNPTKGDSK